MRIISLLFLILLVLSCESPGGEEAQEESAPDIVAEDDLEEATIEAPYSAASERIELREVKDTDELGNLVSYYQLADTTLRHGPYKKYSPDSILLEEALYLDGVYDGKRVMYYSSGDTQIVETYRRGRFEGPYALYYKEGGVKFSGSYTNNVMEGIWYSYYLDGAVKEKVTFADNKENGPFEEYYPDGTLKVSGTYLDGANEDGDLKFFDEEGEHYKTMNCDAGLCRTVWKRDQENM